MSRAWAGQQWGSSRSVKSLEPPSHRRGVHIGADVQQDHDAVAEVERAGHVERRIAVVLPGKRTEGFRGTIVRPYSEIGEPRRSKVCRRGHGLTFCALMGCPCKASSSMSQALLRATARWTLLSGSMNSICFLCTLLKVLWKTQQSVAARGFDPALPRPGTGAVRYGTTTTHLDAVQRVPGGCR